MEIFNTTAHVVFGILANRVPIIIPIFTIYQLGENDTTQVKDMGEFFVGYLLGARLTSFF